MTQFVGCLLNFLFPFTWQIAFGDALSNSVGIASDFRGGRLVPVSTKDKIRSWPASNWSSSKWSRHNLECGFVLNFTLFSLAVQTFLTARFDGNLMKHFRCIGLSCHCLAVSLIVIELCSTSSHLFLFCYLINNCMHRSVLFFYVLLALAKVKHELQMLLKRSFILFSNRVLQLLITFDVTIGGLIVGNEKAPRILMRSNPLLQGKYLETGNWFQNFARLLLTPSITTYPPML